MQVCVCVCACMCARGRILHTYRYTHVSARARTHTHTHIHACMHACMHAHILAYIHTRMLMSACIQVDTAARRTYACGQCPASRTGMICVLLRERHLSHLEQRCRTSSDKACARGRIEPAIGCYCGEGTSRPSHDHTYGHVAMRETPLKDRASLL